MIPTTEGHRQQIERLIAGDLRDVFDKLARSRGGVRTRRALSEKVRKVIAKYREAGVPITFMRGLVNLETGDFHVRAEYLSGEERGPCIFCKGTGRIANRAKRGPFAGGTLLCPDCDGSGSALELLRKRCGCPVIDLQRFRQTRA